MDQTPLPANWTVYIPEMGDLWMGLITSLVVFLLFAVGGVLLYRGKSKDARMKVVVPMLCYVAALLALVSAGGHYLTTMKYPELAIGPARMAVNGEQFPLPRPNDLRLENVSVGLDGRSGQILMLQLGGGRTLALPDDRYPVVEIMRKFK